MKYESKGSDIQPFAVNIVTCINTYAVLHTLRNVLVWFPERKQSLLSFLTGEQAVTCAQYRGSNRKNSFWGW